MMDTTRPQDPDSRCGFVAIVGRPNVGKSTLMNHILGQKLSITSRKPQTTRHQVLGIKTIGPVQAVYVDTPGMHEEEPRAINRYMNKAATSALKGVDVVVFVVDQLAWTTADELVLEKLSSLKCPVILAINKVDKIERRETLLPHLDMLSRKRDFAEMIPVSALRETNLVPLEECVGRFLPPSVHFYPDDQIPQERRSSECACIFPQTWTNIPAYDPNFVQQQAITIDADAYLTSFIPHMHFRGKSMSFAAHRPDGSVQELINIANYNYNWQIEYKLEEPVFVPAGTKVVATGAYDNSTQNKSNPDAARSVPWGDQSWDEMFFGAMSWKNVEQ